MTGAELRAWRERLGKDEAWGAGVCAGLVFACYHEWPRESAAGSERRQAAEGEARWGYDQSEVSALRTAYHAALEAEERAQAERGPVEPVCPEGVWSDSYPQPHYARFAMVDQGCSGFTIGFDGTIRPDEVSYSYTPALLEYAAALSRYRAAIHAASDRQRTLDAVRAAEEARDAARRARDVAEDALTEAIKAHVAARREAGL